MNALLTPACPTPTPPAPRDRAERLVAKLRHRQLVLALRGRAGASARYAQRARRVCDAACGGAA